MSVDGHSILLREGLLAEVIDLRHSVLRTGLPRAAAVFPGDELDSTRHFLAEDGARVVCCATFHLSDFEHQPAWQLRGMASDPAIRGKGLGRGVLQLAEENLSKDASVCQCWCNARKAAEGFYQMLGWRIVSEEFEIPGAGPHVRMWKNFVATPAG